LAPTPPIADAMGKLSSLTLGIISAVGGFIDMGELVTCS
jgi:hypothetical protein